MKESEIDIKNYQNLAAAVVKVAAADYVEALIVIQRGGVLTAQQRSAARKKRAMFKDKKLADKAVKMYIDHCLATNLVKAEIEAEACERFFRSDIFAILMPNTDAEIFIDMLKTKAEANEEIATGYDSFLKHRGGFLDD